METSQAIDHIRRIAKSSLVFPISRNQVVHNRTIKHPFIKRKQERRTGYVYITTLFNERRKAYLWGMVNTAATIGVGWLLFLR